MDFCCGFGQRQDVVSQEKISVMVRFKFLFALALSLLVAGGSALAQRGNILFLDQQRVVSESKAGQSIDSQLAAMTEEVAFELQKRQAALEKDSQDLQANRETLSDEDFTARYNALVGRAQQLEQLKQIRQAELQQARTKAINDLRAQWEPVSQSIFDKKKGYVLLEKQSVLIADDRGDITDEVIAELDAAVTTIQVVKPDLQAQLAAAAQAQQAQQAAQGQ